MKRQQTRLVVIACVLALIFALLPGPTWFLAAKPFALGMVVIYFALEQPQHMGLATAFALGLVADALFGVVMGEYALRLSVLAYITLRFRQRVRFFPMPQQVLGVFGLLLNDRVVSLWIHWICGMTPQSWLFWLPPLSSAVLWPWLYLLFDRLRYGHHKG